MEIENVHEKRANIIVGIIVLTLVTLTIVSGLMLVIDVPPGTVQLP